MNRYIEKNVIWIILLLSALALTIPHAFLWVKPYITIFLGIIMFGIGLTLKPIDFQNELKRSHLIIIAAILKFLLMSAVAYLIAALLKLPLYDFIGLVLVACCPGGTAANVMSYLSKSNTTLTVILTFLTTLIAPFALPALAYFYLQKYIDIQFLGMLKTTMLVIVVPLVLGIILQKLLGSRKSTLVKAFPSISILMIALVIACVVALDRQLILAFPHLVITAVILTNIAGYLIGYILALLFKLTSKDRQSLAFEFGMQDSGLGVVLATTFFNPAAALASALYSVIQNITAMFLVKLFARDAVEKSIIIER